MLKVKKVIKKGIEKIGYRMVPKDFNYPKDLRETIVDPIRAKYFARASSFLLDVPPEKCIILWRYNCGKSAGNPFVDTIIDYCENNHDTYEGSKLEEYYKSFQPDNAAELFNLKGNLHPDLVNYPSHAKVLPWNNADMEGRTEYLERSIRLENRNRGKDLPLEHGIQDYGPISKEKGELEINTLIKLTESIKKHGYLRSGKFDDDITGFVLVKSDNYKFMIRHGMHRAAVLSALDYKMLPVRVERSGIPAFIYRKEVEAWPKVVDGLYTVDQALQVFDLIFEGSG
jgi:hypothetical protein